MRKRWVWLAAAGIAVVAGIVLWLLGGGGNAPAAGNSPRTTVSPTQQTMSPANVRLLEQALNSTDKKEQAKALVPEFRGRNNRLLPDGTKVTINPKLLAYGNAAAVEATTQSGTKYVLRLGRVHDTWLILYTLEEQ